MKLQAFNATIHEINKHKYPTFIGISVGIKPMSEKIALSYLTWAERHAIGPVQILIADKIARFNYLAFSHYTKKGSLARAVRDGDKYENFFNQVIHALPTEKRNCFHIIRWQNIESPQFFRYLECITAEFNSNALFEEVITLYAEKYIKRRHRDITKEKKWFLCQYILHELAVLLGGIYVDSRKYHLILYPTYQYFLMSELVRDIQTG